MLVRPLLRVTFAFLSMGTMALDWPGRGIELSEQYDTAPSAERIRILTLVAASPGADAEALVIRGLSDAQPTVRLAAALLATRYRLGGAARSFVQWLDDPLVDFRAAAARGLGALGDRAVVPALVRLLGDGDAQVRRATVESLATLGGPEVTVPLLDRLADADSGVRLATARVLGELGDGRAVLSLLGALQDSMPEVREATATALGRLHDPRAVGPLLGLLRDPQTDVRVAAVRSVGTLGAASAVLDLAPLALRGERTGDPASRARVARTAIEAIGRIGGPVALGVLVRALRDASVEPDIVIAALRADARDTQHVVRELTAPPIPPSVRPGLVALLGRVGGDQATEALLAMFDADRAHNPPETLDAQRVLPALGETGAPAAFAVLMREASATSMHVVPASAARIQLAALTGLESYARARNGLDAGAFDPLAELLRATLARSETPSTIARVVALIASTHNPRAAGVMAPLLDATSAELREAAARTLSAVGATGVVPQLLGLLADPSPGVRLAAGEALGRSTAPAALRELLERYSTASPLDRTVTARAIARVAATLHDPMTSGPLIRSLDAASPALHDAVLDGLARLAAVGDGAARAALVRTAGVGSYELPAVRALGNALQSTPPNADIVATLERFAVDGQRPDLAAAAVWGLSRGSADVVPTLRTALLHPWPSVAANAAGALARLAHRGIALDGPTMDAVCAVLAQRRDPFVRANLLLVSAWGPRSCPIEFARRALTDGHFAPVRSAGAFAIAHAANAHDAEALRAVLSLCARADREAAVARSCQLALDSASASSAPPAQGPSVQEDIDAQIVAGDGQTPAGNQPVAMALPDGVLYLTVAGPTGWVHERPSPQGEYVVYDPSQMPLEP